MNIRREKKLAFLIMGLFLSIHAPAEPEKKQNPFDDNSFRKLAIAEKPPAKKTEKKTNKENSSIITGKNTAVTGMGIFTGSVLTMAYPVNVSKKEMLRLKQDIATEFVLNSYEKNKDRWLDKLEKKTRYLNKELSNAKMNGLPVNAIKVRGRKKSLREAIIAKLGSESLADEYLNLFLQSKAEKSDSRLLFQKLMDTKTSLILDMFDAKLIDRTIVPNEKISIVHFLRIKKRFPGIIQSLEKTHNTAITRKNIHEYVRKELKAFYGLTKSENGIDGKSLLLSKVNYDNQLLLDRSSRITIENLIQKPDSRLAQKNISGFKHRLRLIDGMNSFQRKMRPIAIGSAILGLSGIGAHYISNRIQNQKKPAKHYVSSISFGTPADSGPPKAKNSSDSASGASSSGK